MAQSSRFRARGVWARVWRRMPAWLRWPLAGAGTVVAYIALVYVVGWATQEDFGLAIALIAIVTLAFGALVGRWPVAVLPAALTVAAFLFERAVDPGGAQCGEDGCAVGRLMTLFWFTLPATVVMLLGVGAGKAARLRGGARRWAGPGGRDSRRAR